MEQPDYQNWVGRSETRHDRIEIVRANALARTLEDDAVRRPMETLGDGDPLPPLWHWIYFWPVVPTHETGVDGHPKRGGFLPPVELPNRMWAGGSLELYRPLTVGRDVERQSTIESVVPKTGRSGSLVFVTVRHDYQCEGEICISERHDIVYREHQAPTADSEPDIAPAWDDGSLWSRTINPTTLLLFRYSALTFNGHRIHYDRDHARIEGYPGLIVHGPLTATLLAEHLREKFPNRRLVKFSYRGQRPLFDLDPYEIQGLVETADSSSQSAPSEESNTRIALRALDPRGQVAMSATGLVEA